MASWGRLSCAGPGLTVCTVGSILVARGFFADRNLPLGLQLFTLGDAFRNDPEGTLDRVARIGYQAVELPGLASGEAKRIRAAADKAGLSVTSIHIPAQHVPLAAAAASQSMTLATDVQLLANELRILGARSLVVPIAPLPTVEPAAGELPLDALARGFRAGGGEHWKRLSALLNERAAQLKPEGIALSYHNHNFEFSPFADTSGWSILMEHTDPRMVFFELDVGWVAAAGLEASALIRKHSSRIRQLHIKDVLPSTPSNYRMSIETTEVGSGWLDWKQVLAEAYRAGVREFYVEQEPPFRLDRFESITKSFGYLASQV